MPSITGWNVDPVKFAAHQAVFRAVKHGDLLQPVACSECGATRRTVAHHDDYSKRLDVRWLCYPCHAQFHFSLRPRQGRRPFTEALA